MPNRYALDDFRTGGSWFDELDAHQMHTMETPPPTAPTAPTGSPAAMPGGAQLPGGYQQGALTGGGGPEQFGGDYQKWFMALVGNRPWNQQTLNSLIPTLEQYGIRMVPPNAAGEQTKFWLPNGDAVRVGFGAGHPEWVVQPKAGGGGFGGGAGGPGAIPPPFQAPSLADLQKEPGYQARLAMGTSALEHSAAAKGSLLSGGTQKALDRYAQDYASNEYGNAYNRAYQTYMGNWQTQSLDPWNRYKDLYGGGLTAALGTKTNTPIFAS